MFFRRKIYGPRDLPMPETDERLYVVGDLHGCDRLLDQLLVEIDADLTANPSAAPARLVCVGDYVDRGEGTQQVLDRLIELATDPALNVTFVRGNHEQLLLSFLEDPIGSAPWLDHGGMETLASYGVPFPLRRRRERDFSGLGADLRERIGDHADFLETLPLYFQSGNIFVSHAGLAPDRPLTAQAEDDLLWGDPRFLELGGPPDMVAVHGHWATERVDFGANRVGVDTGAYMTGRLSALCIDPKAGYRTLMVMAGRGMRSGHAVA
ncbi:MAG: metallophosphoesterase family protein [Pseudomonadota bacterium]